VRAPAGRPSYRTATAQRTFRHVYETSAATAVTASREASNKAEEARVVADSMQDEQSKQLMFGVANEYERVAELTEKRLKRSAIIAWKARCFCIVFAAAAARCGVGASWDLPILSA